MFYIDLKTHSVNDGNSTNVKFEIALAFVMFIKRVAKQEPHSLSVEVNNI